VTTAGEAPGKVILVGEHSVVYGRPAIAVPVWDTRAAATIKVGPQGSGCVIRARDTGQEILVAEADEREPLALVARLALRELRHDPDPDWQIDVTSDIPIASGMGSGAAVNAALVRAIFLQAGEEAAPDTVSRLVYASEVVYHGTPSGIDNSVVAYGQPVWFVRGQEPQVFEAARAFTLAIADSGVPSSTRAMVDGVRERRSDARETYDAWFDAIGEIAQAARDAIEQGQPEMLGGLFDCNQSLLEKIGVSAPVLERLVEAARRTGAGGAKLSGGGGGGNVIALVADETADAVRSALLAAGAKRVIVTTVAG
jgi:mevalonate kinase